MTNTPQLNLKNTEVKIYSDVDLLAHAAATLLCNRLSSTKGDIAVSLAGGSTPKRLYELLASPTYLEQIPWKRVHWFWGDERFVPPDDPQSNFSMFKTTVLSRAPVPATNIHPIPTIGLTPEIAADVYAQELQRFHGEKVLSAKNPLFGVVILGLGEDGHTASLFPGSPALKERSRWATCANLDQAVPRITLTYPALESCHDCLFLVTGSAKRTILRSIFRGDVFPATRLKPQGRCTWLLDQAAAPDG